MATLALAGDTMLGRGVAEHLAIHPVRSLFGDDLLEIVCRDRRDAAQPRVLRLRARGTLDQSAFHFRAPPLAVDAR